MLSLIRVLFLLFNFLTFGSLRLFFLRKKERTKERDLECLSIVQRKLKAILRICKVEVQAEALKNIPKDEAVHCSRLQPHGKCHRFYFKG